MRLVLVGPPGAGKGTQAQFLAAHYSIPHISTGDIFRFNIKNETELGKKVKSILDSGALVPDEVTNDLVRDRLTHDDCANGFLLDGFPRNVTQAEVLRAILAEKRTPLDAVLELSIENKKIIERLSSRRTCRTCGSPAEPSSATCAKDGGELYQREDDKEEVIAKRLAVYEEQTAPIVHFYRTEGLLITITADGEVAEITDRAITALSRVHG
jgi:adenylate kinase